MNTQPFPSRYRQRYYRLQRQRRIVAQAKQTLARSKGASRK